MSSLLLSSRSTCAAKAHGFAQQNTYSQWACMPASSNDDNLWTSWLDCTHPSAIIQEPVILRPLQLPNTPICWCVLKRYLNHKIQASVQHSIVFESTTHLQDPVTQATFSSLAKILPLPPHSGCPLPSRAVCGVVHCITPTEWLGVQATEGVGSTRVG